VYREGGGRGEEINRAGPNPRLRDRERDPSGPLICKSRISQTADDAMSSAVTRDATETRGRWRGREGGREGGKQEQAIREKKKEDVYRYAYEIRDRTTADNMFSFIRRY